MQHLPPPFDSCALDAFVALAGSPAWSQRMRWIAQCAASGPRAGQAIRQRHAIELVIDRLRSPLPRSPSPAEVQVARLAADAVDLADRLPTLGLARLRQVVSAALQGGGTLVPLFHVLHTAALQRARGFVVSFAGLAEAAAFDLLIARDSVEAEVACEVVSAEEGRLLHRRAWVQLADRVDPVVQSWLVSHPGHYLLKMTLPQGLRATNTGAADDDALSDLQRRICGLLATKTRSDQSEAAVLRLDPLILSNRDPAGDGWLPRLRREFSAQAHLSVTASGASMFVMAARAGRVDEIAVAVRRRLAAMMPTRLTGQRPGILAVFVEDTDRGEWRDLRERLELEGEARQFLAYKAARQVIAVSCTSRCELFGAPAPDAAEGGELRFRNPAHPAARLAALGPAIASSL